MVLPGKDEMDKENGREGENDACHEDLYGKGLREGWPVSENRIIGKRTVKGMSNWGQREWKIGRTDHWDRSRLHWQWRPNWNLRLEHVRRELARERRGEGRSIACPW